MGKQNIDAGFLDILNQKAKPIITWLGAAIAAITISGCATVRDDIEAQYLRVQSAVNVCQDDVSYLDYMGKHTEVVELHKMLTKHYFQQDAQGRLSLSDYGQENEFSAILAVGRLKDAVTCMLPAIDELGPGRTPGPFDADRTFVPSKPYTIDRADLQYIARDTARMYLALGRLVPEDLDKLLHSLPAPEAG